MSGKDSLVIFDFSIGPGGEGVPKKRHQAPANARYEVSRCGPNELYGGYCRTLGFPIVGIISASGQSAGDKKVTG